jgi:hypothetical protein
MLNVSRAAQPMLPLRFFRNPSLSGAQVAAFGDGSPPSYVDGLHDALWVGAVVAGAAAVATALLIRGPRRDEAAVPRDIALETA